MKNGPLHQLLKAETTQTVNNHRQGEIGILHVKRQSFVTLHLVYNQDI